MQKVFLIILFLVFSPPSYAIADSKPSKGDIEQIGKKIEEAKKKANLLEKHEISILNEINSYDKERNALLAKNRKILSGLKDLSEKISKRESEIQKTEEELERIREKLKHKILSIYKTNNAGTLLLFLGSENPNEVFKNIKYLEIMAKKEKELIETHKGLTIKLKNENEGLKTEKDNLDAFLTGNINKDNLLKGEREKKYNVLTEVMREERKLDVLIEELNESKKSLMKLIAKFEKEGAEKTFKAFGFEALKGNLPMPANGNISSLFGKQKNPDFNVFTTNNGIDIRAQEGAAIKAIFAGRVVFSEWLKGYGNVLIIDHGEGYYSLYAHAISYLKKTGEKVNSEEIIGYVGDTGSIDGVKLHFEVRHHGKPLDPLAWIRIN